MAKSIQTWLSEYGVSHQNKTNKIIHWICVPSIFLSLIGLLYSIKIGSYTVAHFALLAAIIFYIKLSWQLSIGVGIFSIACLYVCSIINANFNLIYFSITIFVVAWIGQFIGHKIEGKKPSFLHDVQFLLIGPAWLLSWIYQKLNIKY